MRPCYAVKVTTSELWTVGPLRTRGAHRSKLRNVSHGEGSPMQRRSIVCSPVVGESTAAQNARTPERSASPTAELKKCISS